MVVLSLIVFAFVEFMVVGAGLPKLAVLLLIPVFGVLAYLYPWDAHYEIGAGVLAHRLGRQYKVLVDLPSVMRAFRVDTLIPSEQGPEKFEGVQVLLAGKDKGTHSSLFLKPHDEEGFLRALADSLPGLRFDGKILEPK